MSAGAKPLVGVALQPDELFLRHNLAWIDEHAELFEITPETLWGEGCRPGPGYQRLLRFTQSAGRPVCGHGVLFSIGAARAPERRAAWLHALRRDVDEFDMLWLSDHLGFADGDRQTHVAWPLPLPPTDEAVEIVARGLRELRTVCDDVLFENNADLICLGDPREQVRMFARIADAADAGMLLDLHNAYAFCRNVGLDLDTFLDLVPWRRVHELHLSGGSDSDPELLPSRRSMRLDSHDGAVPDDVWRAFDAALPRAVALRAVVCEWFPDAMDERAAAAFRADFERARAAVRGGRR